MRRQEQTLSCLYTAHNRLALDLHHSWRQVCKETLEEWTCWVGKSHWIFSYRQKKKVTVSNNILDEMSYAQEWADVQPSKVEVLCSSSRPVARALWSTGVRWRMSRSRPNGLYWFGCVRVEWSTRYIFSVGEQSPGRGTTPTVETRTCERGAGWVHLPNTWEVQPQVDGKPKGQTRGARTKDKSCPSTFRNQNSHDTSAKLDKLVENAGSSLGQVGRC